MSQAVSSGHEAAERGCLVSWEEAGHHLLPPAGEGRSRQGTQGSGGSYSLGWVGQSPSEEASMCVTDLGWAMASIFPTPQILAHCGAR